MRFIFTFSKLFKKIFFTRKENLVKTYKRTSFREKARKKYECTSKAHLRRNGFIVTCKTRKKGLIRISPKWGPTRSEALCSTVDMLLLKSQFDGQNDLVDLVSLAADAADGRTPPPDPLP